MSVMGAFETMLDDIAASGGMFKFIRGNDEYEWPSTIVHQIARKDDVEFVAAYACDLFEELVLTQYATFLDGSFQMKWNLEPRIQILPYKDGWVEIIVVAQFGFEPTTEKRPFERVRFSCSPVVMEGTGETVQIDSSFEKVV